jgi:hypothetical protein
MVKDDIDRFSWRLLLYAALAPLAIFLPIALCQLDVALFPYFLIGSRIIALI